MTYREAQILFHILSLESRLRILDELRYADACVCHLQHVLQRPQAYVSQQLRRLRDAGMVTTQKEGTLVYYHLSAPLIRQVLEVVLGPPDASRSVDPTCPCPRCSQ